MSFQELRCPIHQPVVRSLDGMTGSLTCWVCDIVDPLEEKVDLLEDEVERLGYEMAELASYE